MYIDVRFCTAFRDITINMTFYAAIILMTELKYVRRLVFDRRNLNYRICLPVEIGRLWAEYGARDLEILFRAEQNEVVVKPLSSARKGGWER